MSETETAPQFDQATRDNVSNEHPDMCRLYWHAGLAAGDQ